MALNHSVSRTLDRLSDYSDESLITELRRIAESVGRNSLTLHDIETYGRCSYATLKNRFGGLKGAMRAAGLSTDQFHRNVADEALLGELARVWDSVLTHEGRRPYKEDMAKYESKFSYGPYYRRWGSWIKACEAVLDWEPGLGSETEQTAETEFTLPHRLLKQKRAIPLKIRYAILLRDQFKCQICGRSPSSTPSLQVDVDHIRSEADGGNIDPSNLRCLCRDCNIGKGKYSEKSD